MSALGAGIWTKCSKSSQSKHVSAVPNSLHNEVSQPCNTVPAFWGTAGGSGPLSPPLPKQRWGQGSPASPLAQALAGDVQSFLCFALIPHPSKQAGFLRPRYALFIGPPGHASGQPGERSLSIPAPDGRALITPVLRVTVRSRQRRLPKAAFRG